MVGTTELNLKVLSEIALRLTPEVWIKGQVTRIFCGKHCLMTMYNEVAREFSLEGRELFTPGAPLMYRPNSAARVALSAAARKLFPDRAEKTPCCVTFNDHPKTTLDDVRAVVAEAMSMVLAGEV